MTLSCLVPLNWKEIIEVLYLLISEYLLNSYALSRALLFFTKAHNLFAYVIYHQLQSLRPYSHTCQQSLMARAGFDCFSKSLQVAGNIHQSKSCEGAFVVMPIPFAPNCKASCQNLAGKLQACQLDKKCRFVDGVIESDLGVRGHIQAMLMLEVQIVVFIRSDIFKTLSVEHQNPL